MAEYLLDTHIWLWYLTGHTALSQGLRRAIQRSVEHCWLSPVSVWEIGLLVKRGRLDLDRPLRPWVDEAFVRLPLNEASMTREVALRSHEIELVDPDPADRLLAATALVNDLTLLTVDSRLASSEWLPTRSS